jgi:beta-glucosidase/6-phospho-beta-glucosidase/beta-galactosidase
MTTLVETPRLAVLTGFESTYLPAFDVDVLETSLHCRRLEHDLDAVRAAGVEELRYPVRWHRVEPTPGEYDWSETDHAMDALRARGLRPVVDLVHHTSYPRWLTHGFGDARFHAAYVRYCIAVAERYPWIGAYTLFNEPFATLWLAGHEGVWPPHGRGLRAFVALLRNVLPAITEAAAELRRRLPAAHHVYVDTLEGHDAIGPAGVEYARLANDRRHVVLDLLLGRARGDAPYVREVRRAGGGDLLRLPGMEIDVLGLDYYAHSEWAYDDVAHAPSPVPRGPAALAAEYAERYPGFRLALTETNVRGASSDRATWLRYTLGECERARADGVPLESYCWFPFVDSLDWNSLLRRADNWIDPVGVLWLDDAGERGTSSMHRSFAAAAAGAPADALPAYRFTPLIAETLRSFLPLMTDFPWQPAPPDEVAEFDGGALVRLRRQEVAA